MVKQNELEVGAEKEERESRKKRGDEKTGKEMQRQKGRLNK